MARKAVARVGDSGSHGGSIVSGATSICVNSRPIARVGDLYDCPVHGQNPITTGAKSVFGQGKLVAHVGSKTACEAVITSGSPDTFINVDNESTYDNFYLYNNYDEQVQLIDPAIKGLPYYIKTRDGQFFFWSH